MVEERAALREAVRGLLGSAGPDAGLWARLCKEIGVAGLIVPEAYGGAGATLAEAAIVLEELGRVLSPAPMLGTLLAVEALLRSGDEEARRRLLPAVCAGERVVTVAWDGSGNVTDGLVSGVFPDVFAAGTVLVTVDGALHEVEIEAEVTATLDVTRQVGTLRLDAVPGRRLNGPAPVLRDLACAALAAEQVGTAERALELTVAHVKDRHQFGRPIGSFQVLQHRLAEAYIRVQAARSASESAVEALVSGSPEAGRLAAVAKITCSETLRAVAAEMVQMHGGIAITWEHDAHRYLRRAWASARLYGSPDMHVARLTPTVLVDFSH
ncbi:acyl-CoA dehydrogenase family protein [Actinoplanes sp. NPDC023801]|uniref:acyl-CoA dehydrogenase family protein n=1 Tax=Actinoplanes sp. NPDC023801 TaxID=3154595 RepID=UPI0033CC9102